MSTERDNKIFAPFTLEEVDTLNLYQRSGVFHEFTCGSKTNHESVQQLLVATETGWKCADENCDYIQNWAHKFMADRPFIVHQMNLLLGQVSEI